jgi:hypothetical protein
MRDHAADILSLRHAIALIDDRDAPAQPPVDNAGGTIMVARKTLAVVSLIAFAIAAQPALAQNGNVPPAADPSAGPAPAKRPHKHQSGKHRRQHKPGPQQQGNASSNSG